MKTSARKPTRSTVHTLPGARPTYWRSGAGMPLPQGPSQRCRPSRPAAPVRRLATGWLKSPQRPTKH